MRYIRILALVAALAVSLAAVAQEAGKKSEETANRADLEKQLWEVDQKWLEGARTKNLDFLKQLWTDQFFEVLPVGEPVSKSELLDLLAKGDRGPGVGAFPSDFKLRAVYGNFAIATDHTTLKGSIVGGRNLAGEYRVIRFFVKEKGKWRVAGAGLIPITSP